jgi:hypothetical protein
MLDDGLCYTCDKIKWHDGPHSWEDPNWPPQAAAVPARQDAVPEKENALIGDLVMLIRRQVVRLMQKDERDVKLARECMDYLRRKELAGGADILRVPATQPTQTAVGDDELYALVWEVAPPPICVSEMAIRQLAPALRELIERRRAQTAVGGGELPELVVTDDDRAEANRRLDDDDRAPSQYRLLLEVLVTRERQLRDAIAQRDEAREHAKFKTNMANDLNELLEARPSPRGMRRGGARNGTKQSSSNSTPSLMRKMLLVAASIRSRICA